MCCIVSKTSTSSNSTAIFTVGSLVISTFQFAGLLLATTGLVMNYNHTPQIGKVPPGHLLVALGVITSSTGVFINLNSYKHLHRDSIQ